ncbi:MAG: hypothetical protein ACK40G_03630 [Cytophagaceae bacterium]
MRVGKYLTILFLAICTSVMAQDDKNRTTTGAQDPSATARSAPDNEFNLTDRLDSGINASGAAGTDVTRAFTNEEFHKWLLKKNAGETMHGEFHYNDNNFEFTYVKRKGEVKINAIGDPTRFFNFYNQYLKGESKDLSFRNYLPEGNIEKIGESNYETGLCPVSLEFRKVFGKDC